MNLTPCPFCGGESFKKDDGLKVKINCSVCGLHEYSKEEYEFANAHYVNILRTQKKNY